MPDYQLTTDRHTARKLRDIAAAAETGALVGVRPASRANTSKSSVIVKLISEIEATDYSQHPAKLMKLVAGVWTETGQTVLVRKINGTAIAADGTRLVARPISNLGLCVDGIGTAESTYPLPTSYCCGGCVSISRTSPGGKAAATSYKFMPPYVACCLDCETGNGDTATDIISGEQSLTWDGTDELFVSADADCGDDGTTVRWELNVDDNTLIFRESTGTALATYTAALASPDWLCPQRMELSAFNSDCYVCGHEACVKPTAGEPSVGCFGCDSSEEFGPIWSLDPSDSFIIADPLTESESYTYNDGSKIWTTNLTVERPDASIAGSFDLAPGPTGVGAGVCDFYGGSQELHHWRAHVGGRASGACGASVNADIELGGTAEIGIDDPTRTIPYGTTTETWLNTRPSGMDCGDPVPGICGGGTPPTWSCHGSGLGVVWVMHWDGSTTGRARLFLFVVGHYYWTRTNDTTDETGWGLAAETAYNIPGGLSLDSGYTISVDKKYTAEWAGTSVCGGGAVTLTKVTDSGNWDTLPTTITIRQVGGVEPPAKARGRRNCEDAGGVTSEEPP